MAEWCSGFFVGPYVEFVDANGAGLPGEDYEDRRSCIEFSCCSLTGGPSFSPADRAGPRHVFWRGGSTDEATAGAFSGCGSSYGTADLSRVSPADEVRWFSTTYAPVLDWLARHYGRPPSVRWGLVWFGYEQCSAFLPASGASKPAEPGATSDRGGTKGKRSSRSPRRRSR